MYNYFGAYFPEHKCRQETYFRMINLHLMYIFISIGFFNSNLFAKLNNVQNKETEPKTLHRLIVQGCV